MNRRLGFLPTLTLAATLAFAANIARADQPTYQGLNGTVNTSDIVCEPAVTSQSPQNVALLKGGDGSTVYLSFLINPGEKSGSGYAWSGLLLSGDSYYDSVFIGQPAAGASNQFVLETVGGSGQVPSGVVANTGQTAFIVVKAQLQSGNDIFTLYVNPGDKEPTSGTVKTDLDIGSLSSLAIYSNDQSFCVDQIRIGPSYSDVAP